MCDKVVNRTSQRIQSLQVLPQEKNIYQSVKVARVPGQLFAPNTTHHLVILGDDARSQRSYL